MRPSGSNHPRNPVIFFGTVWLFPPEIIRMFASGSQAAAYCHGHLRAVVITNLLKDSPFLGYRIIWWNSLFGYCLGGSIAWTYYFSRRWQKNASAVRNRN